MSELRELLERVSYAYPPGYAVSRDEHGLPIITDPEFDGDDIDDPGHPSRSAVTAAAKPAPQWRLDRELGRKLAAIDREVTTNLAAHCDAVLARVVERAANKIRASKGREKHRASVFPSGSDPRAVVAAAGRSIADGLTDAELLDDGIDELRARFHSEVDGAARAVERLLSTHLDKLPVLTAAGRASGVADALRANTTGAWGWLASRLRARAAAILYGEREPSDQAVTPVALVRGALAKVGGLGEQSRGVNDDGTLSAGESTGVATGAIALRQLTKVGALVVGHEWQYPPIQREYFTPHQRLADVTFADWDDPQLATRVGDEWIGDHYYPLDHDSCRCFTSPVAILPLVEGADPRSDEVAELRRQAGG